MAAPIRILLVSGSTRHGSTNTATLRTAQALAPGDAAAVLYARLSDLPAFNPDVDDEAAPEAVTDLRAQLATADAVVFCTPEYAGSLPGSFKNLLDWTVGSGELYGKPVAWINVAAPGRGQGAHASLDTVLGYVGAVIIEPACRRIPVARDAVGADGLVADEHVRTEIAQVLRNVVQHVRDIT